MICQGEINHRFASFGNAGFAFYEMLEAKRVRKLLWPMIPMATGIRDVNVKISHKTMFSYLFMAKSINLVSSLKKRSSMLLQEGL